LVRWIVREQANPGMFENSEFLYRGYGERRSLAAI